MDYIVRRAHRKHLLFQLLNCRVRFQVILRQNSMYLHDSIGWRRQGGCRESMSRTTVKSGTIPLSTGPCETIAAPHSVCQSTACDINSIAL